MNTETLNLLLSIGAIIMQVASIFLICFFYFSEKENKFRHFLKKHSLGIGFLAILSAVVGSLIYSNVIGYAPCDLCWYIRIVLYPQLVICCVGYFLKDSVSWLNIRILSGIGLCIGVFQYYGQMFNDGVLPCSAAAVSCAKLYFVEFGYITIPMMAISIFIFMFALSLFRK